MLPPYLIFRYACFAFFLGVLIFSIFAVSLEPFYWYSAALVSTACIAFFWNRGHLGLIALLLAAFFIGSFRISGITETLEQQRDSVQRLPLFTIVDGTVIAEPRIQENRQSFIVEGFIRELSAIDTVRVYISTGLAPRHHIGDRVGYECKKHPNAADTGWFISQRVAAYCSHPRIAAVSEYIESPNGSVATILGRFRTSLVQTIERWIPAPHAQLISGILVGDRTGFSRELSLLFAAVGISHIVAISGYNITILILAVAPFVRRLRIARTLQTLVLVIAIALFTIFTGGSSATIRAAFMGIITLIGLAAGRRSGGIQALIAAGVFMVFLDPLALYYDRGFQLSFAATAGLIIFSPLMSYAVRRITDVGGVKTIAIQTLCATIGTIPILLVGFGSYSPISLVANLFIVPLIPVIMAVSFVWMIIAYAFSFIPYQIAFVFDAVIQITSLPIWALAEYVFGVSRFFASMPVPKITFENSVIGIVALVVLYALLAVAGRRIALRVRSSIFE